MPDLHQKLLENQPLYQFTIHKSLMPPVINPEKSCIIEYHSMINLISFEGTLLSIDPLTETFESEVISPINDRFEFSVSLSEENLIICGGRSGDFSSIYADLLIFDLEEKNWKNIMVEPIPNARYRHSSCVIGDILIVFGGIGPKGWLRDIFALFLPALTWIEIKKTGFVEHSYTSWASALVNQKIFTYGVFRKNQKTFNEFGCFFIKEFVAYCSRIKIPEKNLKMYEILALEGKNDLIIIIGVTSKGIVSYLFHSVTFIWTEVVYVDEIFYCPSSVDQYQITRMKDRHIVFLKFSFNP